MMVHAKSAPVDFHFLATLAKSVGATHEQCLEIEGANTATQVGDMMREWGHHGFFEVTAEACCRQVLDHIGGGMTISTDLTTLKGDYLGGARIDE